MAELTSMANIGKEMEKKLTSVGIDSSEKLIEAGAKWAFLKLKEKKGLKRIQRLFEAVVGEGRILWKSLLPRS
ncbi:MAG: TfoX/Sxy family DNA transformation protein [Lachnospiraceae bacterium]|nr:TfoX/Sxy family DNA transformation protein [Lachnospiraceae bacterium]